MRHRGVPESDKVPEISATTWGSAVDVGSNAPTRAQRATRGGWRCCGRFARPSLGCHVHREFMCSALLDVTPITHATTCHQRSYVERYSSHIDTMSIWQTTESICEGVARDTGYMTQASHCFLKVFLCIIKLSAATAPPEASMLLGRHEKLLAGGRHQLAFPALGCHRQDTPAGPCMFCPMA
jgi:hypothetical protein